jgi:hypothetical protein
MQEPFGHARLELSVHHPLSFGPHQVISLISIYCFAPLFIPHIADFLCPILLFQFVVCFVPYSCSHIPSPVHPPGFSPFFLSTYICLDEAPPYRRGLLRANAEQNKHLRFLPPEE